MIFTTIFTNLFFAFTTFIIFFTQVQALPLTGRDVFVPHIFTPNANTVWPIGSVQTVTWDISDAPTQITNKIGRVVLRKGELATDIVLAENFDILDASTSITVPNVTPDSDYSIVLFGDSGNWSDQFSIIDPQA